MKLFLVYALYVVAAFALVLTISLYADPDLVMRMVGGEEPVRWLMSGTIVLGAVSAAWLAVSKFVNWMLPTMLVVGGLLLGMSYAIWSRSVDGHIEFPVLVAFVGISGILAVFAARRAWGYYIT